MLTRAFRFSTLGYLALEGVGALHASYTLLLNITEHDVKEGKELFLFASMLCNAARAYGSGVIKPWCTVENNIDSKKHILDPRGSSLALTPEEILIGGARFTLQVREKIQPALKIVSGYVLNTEYAGSLVPFPGKATHYISLNKFRQV